MSLSRCARNTHPKIRCANLGPRFGLPIPAPSARPLTKGAFLRNVFRAVERVFDPLPYVRIGDSGSQTRSTGEMTGVAA